MTASGKKRKLCLIYRLRVRKQSKRVNFEVADDF